MNITVQAVCCPVCAGRGLVPAGFYHPYNQNIVSNTTPEKCRSCTNGVIIIKNQNIITTFDTQYLQKPYKEE